MSDKKYECPVCGNKQDDSGECNKCQFDVFELAKMSEFKAKTIIQPCPNFPFFGATYADAGCINGMLFDLDNCDDSGNLYEQSDCIPCPFCNGEEFVKRYSSFRSISWKEARQVKNNLIQLYKNQKA